MNITVFTDGSSRGNPGPGGWGAVVVDGGNVTELGGAEKNTTNNKMELTAAIHGLKKVSAHDDAVVYTDSSYVINGITKWIKGWKRNNWMTQTKQEVMNRDLWEKLHELADSRKVKWEYVGGHMGVVGNERCDHIATAFADGRHISLYDGPLSGYDIPNILDVSHDLEQASVKKSESSRSRARAYSYVSSVNGEIKTHSSWEECEKRVKGQKGARYKKAVSADDEAYIIREFGAF